MIFKKWVFWVGVAAAVSQDVGCVLATHDPKAASQKMVRGEHAPLFKGSPPNGAWRARTLRSLNGL